MNKKINWGILAPGGIAHKFASDLKLVPDARLVAVGSRDASRANEFAKKFKIPQVFSSYEALAKSPDVDIVYVASPHTFHFEHAMLCLENGKHVLCEKPMGMNSGQIARMVEKAKENKLFLMEAFWTRFIPSYLYFRESVKNGTIGEIVYIQADFGLLAPENPQHRLRNKELGGGSLLDIGIYPVFLALDIAGIPEEISAKAVLDKNGIDELCSIIFHYTTKKIIACLSSTILSKTPVEAIVCGTKGRVKLNSMFHIPTSVELTIDSKTKKTKLREKGFGYEYEIMEVNKCLLEGKTESGIFSLETSNNLHSLLDKIRQQIGLKYQADS
jgi:predicted dehydrogenase